VVPSKMYGILAGGKTHRSCGAGRDRRGVARGSVRLAICSGSGQSSEVANAVRTVGLRSSQGESHGRGGEGCCSRL